MDPSLLHPDCRPIQIYNDDRWDRSFLPMMVNEYNHQVLLKVQCVLHRLRPIISGPSSQLCAWSKRSGRQKHHHCNHNGPHHHHCQHHHHLEHPGQPDHLLPGRLKPLWELFHRPGFDLGYILFIILYSLFAI